MFFRLIKVFQLFSSVSLKYCPMRKEKTLLICIDFALPKDQERYDST